MGPISPKKTIPKLGPMAIGTLIGLALTFGGLVSSKSQTPLPRDIQTDGSLGVPTTLGGLDVIIPANLGKEIGDSNSANLFHSFARFNVRAGGSATFTGPDNISNIISRVTGTQNSMIDGQLASSINNANLFLLNPNGVIFGSNASIDINGSFHVSTANFLRFNDDFEFHTLNQNEPLLTAAPPTAFGFLNHNTGQVKIQAGSQLSVSNGNTLSFVGGYAKKVGQEDNGQDIIEKSVLLEGGTFTAPDGRINLIGLARNDSPTEQKVISLSIETTTSPIQGNSSGSESVFIKGGVLTIESADIKPNSGDVTLIAKNITTRDSTIQTDATGTELGGTITLMTNNDEQSSISLTDTRISSKVTDIAGSEIQSETTPPLVTIKSPKLTMALIDCINCGIFVATRGSRNAGAISIDINGEAKISGIKNDDDPLPINIAISNLVDNAFATGKGGALDIKANDLIIDFSQIDTGTFLQNQHENIVDGQGGDINLTAATGNMTISNSLIVSDTQGPGKGGNTVLSAEKGILTVQDNSIINTKSSLTQLFSPISDQSTNEVGVGGDLLIFAKTLKLKNNSKLTSEAISYGNAGDITLNIDTLEANVVSDEGMASDFLPVTITSNSTGEKNISDTINDGAAGRVTIQGLLSSAENPVPVANLITLNNTTITTEAKGDGAGGPITIAALDKIALTDTRLSANVTDETGSSEEPANITVTTPNLMITGGGLTAQSTGSRDAGRITLNVDSLTTQLGNKDITFSDDLTTKRVQLSSSSTAAGAAGNLVVQGEGGNGTAVANTLALADTDLSTEAKGTGAGGTIDITGNSTTTFTDSTLSANVANGPDPSTGSTGSITVVAPTLAMAGGGITAQSTGERAAGDITINVDQLTTQLGNKDITFSDDLTTKRVQLSSSSSSPTADAGDAGDITMQGQTGATVAGPISLTDTDVTTDASGGGKGGTISLAATDTITLEHSILSANVTDETDSNDEAADITLTTPSLRITGGGLTAQSAGSRNAGAITLNTQQLTTALGNKDITFSDTLTTKRVQLSSSSSSPTADAGDAGDITMQGQTGATVAGPISLTDTDVTTDASGGGRGGTISLAATDTITLEHSILSANVTDETDSNDEAADITLTTPSLRITGGGLTAQSAGSRNAGAITLNTQQLTTALGNKDITFSDTLTTKRVQLSSSSSSPTADAGDAGDITMQGQTGATVAGPISLTDTDVTTDASGGGRGGTISLAATDTITLEHSILSANVTDETDSNDEAADITLTTPSLRITGGGLTAQSAGSRNAGAITLNTQQLTTALGNKDITFSDTLTTKRVQLSSSSSSPTADAGDAGDITMQGQTGATVAGPISLTDTDVTTDASGGGKGGTISLAATDTITLEHSILSANVTDETDSNDEAADITLTTPSLRITGGGLTAQSAGSRNAGAITLNTQQLTTALGNKDITFSDTLTTKRVQLSSSSSSPTADAGDAGDITMQGQTGATVAGPISLTDTDVTTDASGGGKGGTISLAATDTITLEHSILSANVTDETDSNDEAADITLTTPSLRITGGGLTAQSAGSRNAGAITLNTQQLTTALGNKDITFSDTLTTKRVQLSSSSSSPTADAGDAGDITMQGQTGATVAGPISLTDTDVTTDASGGGRGGTISLAATDTITLEHSILSANVTDETDSNDEAADITLTTPSLRITGGGLTAQSAGSRNAGAITLNTQQLTTALGNKDITFSDTLTTKRVQLSSSSSSPTADAGDAGDITMQGQTGATVAGPISLTDTDVTTDASGGGKGGTISLAATDTITLEHSILSANVTDETDSNDEAADITLTTPSLRITGGGLTAQSAGSRNAGAITLNTQQLTTALGNKDITFSDTLTTKRVQLSSSSSSPTADAGDAGDITMQGQTGATVAGPISLTDTDVTTDASGGGKGGTISLAATDTITLEHSILSANVTDETDSNDEAADITLTTPSLRITGGGLTAQSAGSRNAGAITLNTQQLTTALGNKDITFSDTLTTKRVQLSSSSSSPTADAGDAGDITMQGQTGATVAGPISLTDTDVTTDASGGGKGGTISLAATDTITLEHSILSANVTDETDSNDEAADITLTTPSLRITGGGLTAQSAGSRNAGAITLNTQQLTTALGNKDITFSDTLTTKRVQLSSSSSSPTADAGDAGDITMQGQTGATVAGPISLTDTDVTTDASGGGKGGTISLAATDTITLEHSILSANVTDETDSNDEAADITLTTPSLRITGGGLTAQSAGSRNAGAITLNTQQLTTALGNKDITFSDTLTTKRVQLSSSSSSPTADAGDAGDITMQGQTGATVAGPISLTDTDVTTDASGGGKGGTISLAATDTITLEHSILSANVTDETDSNDEAADITLTTPSLRITGGGLTAQSAGSRNAGAITLNTQQLTTALGNKDITFSDTLTTKRVQLSSSSTGAAATSGNAGNVTILADSATPGTPAASAGTIALNDTDISTAVAPDGEGTGGKIKITANGASDSALTITNSSIVATVHNAPTGMENNDRADITLKSPSTTITDRVTEPGDRERGIETETTGNRNAGDVNVKTDSFFSEGALLTSSTSGAGNAGTVIIEGQASPVAGPVTLIDTKVLSESTSTGNAGFISIDADGDITLANGTTVSAQAIKMNGSAGTGDAGRINIASKQVFQSTGSSITTAAESGKGGDITVTGASKTILDSTTVSASVNDTGGNKVGGNIIIKGGTTPARNPNFGQEQLLIRNGTTIEAESLGFGDAGTINLLSDGTIRVADSNITTKASQASGGIISLQSGFLVHALNSTIESSVGGPVGSDGGNIQIQGGELVILQNSAIFARAQEGRGGNIRIIASAFLRDGFTIINADSQFGVSGTVAIDSPIQNLSGAIAPLPETIIQTASLYGEQCAAQKGGAFSSFSIRGRDRIPFEPGDYLLTPLLQNEDGKNLLKRTAPSSSPMAFRLGLSGFDSHRLDVFTSFIQGDTSLEIFEGGCRS